MDVVAWSMCACMDLFQVISTSDTISNIDLASSVEIPFCVFGRNHLTWVNITTYRSTMKSIIV